MAAIRIAVAGLLCASLCAPAAASAQDGFSFSSRRLDDALRARIVGSSWHRGCPVGLGRLRYVRVAHWGWHERRRVGELVVNADAVPAIRSALERLYRAHFPIRRMRLVDDYGASDYASIEADNTSAFNCRRATGQTRWSEHAYGRAIDVNPIENPYVYANGTTSHAASRPYLHRRHHRRGMAFRGGALVRAFAAVGWGWGGDWPGPWDYQHFSASGR